MPAARTQIRGRRPLHHTNVLTQRARRSTPFLNQRRLVEYDSSPEPTQTPKSSETSSSEPQDHQTELDAIEELLRDEERWQNVWTRSLEDPEPKHQQLHRDMVLAEKLQELRGATIVARRYRKKVMNHLAILEENLRHQDGLLAEIQAKVLWRLHQGHILDLVEPEEEPLPIPNPELTQPPDTPPTDIIWRCAVCHNLNPPERSRCQNCDGKCKTCKKGDHRSGSCWLPMGPQMLKGDVWTCSRCEYDNPKNLDQCERCWDTCRTCHELDHAEAQCPHRGEITPADQDYLLNAPIERDYRTATEDELIGLGVQVNMVQDLIAILEQEEGPLDLEGLYWVAEHVHSEGSHRFHIEESSSGSSSGR